MNGFRNQRRRSLKMMAALGMAPGYALAQATKPGAAAARPATGLDALIKAARAEGEVVFYSTPTDNINKRVADDFAKRFGVRASFVRGGSAQIQQRYSAEAEAGNIAVDLLVNSGSTAVLYAEDGIKKGWFDPVSQANLPATAQFPKRFITGPTALVQIALWVLMYNTEKVKGGDIPKDWPDLLNPKWKAQILISDPSVADAYIEFWSLLLAKYGGEFFTKLRPNLRPVTTGVQASQGIGAGEGSLLVPATIAQVTQIKDRGAPVNYVVFDYTTGVEQHITLTARGRAKHPNAARLFAHYLMTPEGNKLLNDDPGGSSMYETHKLPKQYQAPNVSMVLAKKAQIIKMLGF